MLEIEKGKITIKSGKTSPKYRWRIYIEFMKGRKTLFIYKDNRGSPNVKSMKEYYLM